MIDTYTNECLLNKYSYTFKDETRVKLIRIQINTHQTITHVHSKIEYEYN